MNKKENVTSQLANVRITRARAKALGASLNPNVERQVLRENPKRSASSECVPNGQCKRRAVLKDVTNALQKNSYKNCFNTAKPKECKLIGGRLRKSAKEVSATGKSILLGPLKTAEEKFEAQKEDPPPLLLKGNESVAQSSCGSIEFGVSKLMIRQIPKHTPLGRHSEKDIDKLGITDIDSKKDPQLCSLYVSEIYSHLRVTELERRPSHNFMETIQRDITQSMRAILIDWLVEVTEEYKLVPDTLYLTVNLIDRFLSENYIEKQRLQLVGVSCMLIASKYEEICAPRVEEFCFITDNTYSKEEVLGMESQVLNFLHFQLSVPTTKTFLRRFIHVAQAINKVPCLELEFLANYLAELTLTEYSFVKFLPSLTAASALYLARWTLDQSCDPWNSTLEHYTSYTTTELKATVLELQDLQLNINGCILNAIRDKYRQPKFKCVAELSANKPVQSIFLEISS